MKRRLLRQTLATLVLTALTAGTALAQDNVLDLRVVELDPEGTITYQNFIYARVFKEGRFLFEALHLRIPTVDYKEVSVGGGYRVAQAGDLQVYALGHVAKATDGTYFQPALLLQDAKGRLTGSMFVQHYAPLTDEGAHQWLIDPIEAQYAVAGRVSLGGSGYFYKAPGLSWLRKVGPKISVADRFGATEFRAARVDDQGATGWEFQFRRIVVF